MKTLVVIVAASVLLSGCVHAFVKDLTPEAKATLAEHFLDKCSGGFHFSAGGATGQLGGGAHADLDLTGTCGPAMVPLSQIDKLAPASPN